MENNEDYDKIKKMREYKRSYMQNYRIVNPRKKKECNTCKKFIRADDIRRHERTKRHLDKLYN